MDKALKQRLVGASVLIALAVVVLPMLLSGQPENQQEARRIEVPPTPSELSFETRRFPLGQQSDEQPSVVDDPTAPGSGAKDPEPGPKDKNLFQERQLNGTVNTPDKPTALTVDVPERNALPGRYLVQVASFSTAANANRLAARLREDGMSVMMDTIEAAVGTLHRVRVGPFDQPDEADAAIAQIRNQTPDVNPRIIDLRPDESAPVTDPTDPLARWVVQVGSFSEQSNAESLVEQLRSGLILTALSWSVTDPHKAPKQTTA